MVQKLELFPTSYEYSIGKYNNLKEMFVRGDVDISGNIVMTGNINCNEINSTSITATTFYGDGSQLTGIITSGGSANLNDHSDASFGNVDVSGNININGKATITINDVNAQNITLLEMKTHSNTPRIKHDFWQNSTGYGDYQIYPASAATTDFKIGGYSSTFQTIRLNALNGIEVYSNQSTNTFGKLKCGTLELTNKIQGPTDLIIDPSPYDSSGGNVTVMGNLKVDGLLDMSNNIIMNNNKIIFTASDSSIIPQDSGIITRVQDISNTLTNVVTDISSLQTEMNAVEGNITILQDNVSNLLTSNNDSSFNNVEINGTLNVDNDANINGIKVGDVFSVSGWNGIRNANIINGGDNDFALVQYTNGHTVINSSYGSPLNFNIANSTKAYIDTNGYAYSIYCDRILFNFKGSGTHNGTIVGMDYVQANTDYIRFCTSTTNQTYTGANASIRVSQVWSDGDMWSQAYNTYSDDRMKHNEINITNGLEIIKKLKPQVYDKTDTMKEENYNGVLEEGSYYKESGFIAQEVNEIDELKHLVSINENIEGGIYMLNYTGIIPYNTAAIKELDVIVKNQQNEINEQNTRIQELENKVQSQETLINQLISRIEALENP